MRWLIPSNNNNTNWIKYGISDLPICLVILKIYLIMNLQVIICLDILEISLMKTPPRNK